ncbi:fumarylacetoacetate hydrolase family protein [Phenylobacterium sp.]|uniref:fumarylacetoacetate hydrolase family protein n=1 Tax=Phenylobacterium sp. TaxID=1871053 RepID=UPI00301C8C27
MKLVTFVEPRTTRSRLGVLLDDNGVLDLQAAQAAAAGFPREDFESMQHLIEAGAAGLDQARKLVGVRSDMARPLADVTLLAPLPRPVQLRDCMCFEGHLIGSTQAAMRRAGLTEPSLRHKGMAEVFKVRPIYYKANRFAVTGPGTTVVWPAYSQAMDYELEMGCVLGRGGTDISKADASGHIFGFTIFNDFSARDTQGFEMTSGLGPSKSKDFDNGNAMGPCIVTADEFDPYDAAMIARVNGEVRSEGHSSSMTYSFEDLISFISTSETLHPGEILGSGTVGGGCGLEQDRLLESGDEVELEIVGIGRLRNRVLAAGQA